jgi:hypothetical protein
MRIAQRIFSGIAPRLDPRRLGESNAQTALNCDLRNGTLRALRGTSAVWALTKPGTIRTIYRFGQTISDEALYWFHWADDVDVCRGQIAGDTDERTYFTGDSTFGHPRVTKASIALIGGTDYPMASYRLGVPFPAAAPNLVSVTGVGDGVVETRQYVYTYVTGDGEEGPPSLPRQVNAKEGQTVNLSGLLVPPAGDYNITSKRIYRTVSTDATPTDYQFVAQISEATTTYADSKLARELAEVIPSMDWEPPPAGLQGLVNMPNGMMAGFLDNDVYFCEPYRGFAWPSKYRQACDAPVVGLGVFAETLVVVTRANPVIMYGSDPGTIVVRKSELAEAGVSKRGIVSMSGGVLYPSPNGLVKISPAGGSLITEGIIDKEFWTSLNPASIEAYHYDGRYIGFYDNGTPAGFQFDPADGNQPFSMLEAHADAGYTDMVRDSLYLNVAGTVRQWDEGGAPYTYTWRSRVNELPHECNFGWGQVIAGAYPLTLKVYADGVLKHSQVVASREPFRLPSGFVALDWELELTGTAKVTAVYLAQGIDELKAE